MAGRRRPPAQLHVGVALRRRSAPTRPRRRSSCSPGCCGSSPSGPAASHARSWSSVRSRSACSARSAWPGRWPDAGGRRSSSRSSTARCRSRGTRSSSATSVRSCSTRSRRSWCRPCSCSRASSTTGGPAAGSRRSAGSGSRSPRPGGRSRSCCRSCSRSASRSPHPPAATVSRSLRRAGARRAHRHRTRARAAAAVADRVRARGGPGGGARASCSRRSTRSARCCASPPARAAPASAAGPSSVVALLVLLIAGGDSARWAARWWGIALLAWLLAALPAWLGSASPDPEGVLVPAALAVALLAGLGTASFLGEIRRLGLGWRQAGARARRRARGVRRSSGSSATSPAVGSTNRPATGPTRSRG